MVADGCCFNDGVGTNMNVVSDLHWIIIEISAVRFVWWPVGEETLCVMGIRWHGMSANLMMQPSPTRQYLPRDMTTAWPGPVLLRSPRIIAPLDMIVLPPRIMFCGPAIVARRETLLPVSFQRVQMISPSKIGLVHTVSMNSAFE